MLLEELDELLQDILPPGFQITTDKKGQLIIKTGLKDEDGELVSLDQDDEDPDFDPDFEPLDGLDDDEDD